MKRIVGRRMADRQIDDYPSMKVPPLNPDLVEVSGQPFRYRWASDIIDNLRAAGSVCYHYLDIGTYNGLMAIIAAKKHTDGDLTIIVDAIEAHKQSFEAADAAAKAAVARGLKITVHNVMFEDYKTDTVYDIISAFEMLEHMRCPMFSIEKVYELLEIGGHFMLTVPEESGPFGIGDKNPFHYWTSTIQSLVLMFHDDRKWKIKQVFEEGGLIHMLVQKKSYMA